MDGKIVQSTEKVPPEQAPPDADGALTGLQIALIAVCALGLAIDLSEIALGGVLSSVFSARPHHLLPSELSWLVSAVYIGAILGAPLGALLISRAGARATLAGVMFWLAATSLAAAASGSVRELVAARLLSGLALGAYPPLVISFLTDRTPHRQRGKVILMTSGLAYLGPPMTIFATRWLTAAVPLGIEGWRWPFVAATVLAGLAGLGFLRLAHSPGTQMSGVDAAARSAAGDKSPLKPSIAHPTPEQARSAWSDWRSMLRKPYGWPLASAATVMLVTPFANVAFPLVTGPILLQRGVTLSDTLLYIGLGSLGPVVGTLALGMIVDRLSRRFALAAAPAFMLATVLAFLLAPSAMFAAIAVLAFGIASALYQPVLLLGVAEVLPRGWRAAGTSVAWTVNRVGAATAPILLLQMVASGRSLGAGAVMVGALLICIAAAGPLARRSSQGAESV